MLYKTGIQVPQDTELANDWRSDSPTVWCSARAPYTHMCSGPMTSAEGPSWPSTAPWGSGQRNGKCHRDAECQPTHSQHMGKRCKRIALPSTSSGQARSSRQCRTWNGLQTVPASGPSLGHFHSPQQSLLGKFLQLEHRRPIPQSHCTCSQLAGSHQPDPPVTHIRGHGTILTHL